MLAEQKQAIKELREQVEVIAKSLDIILSSEEPETPKPTNDDVVNKARKAKAEYQREYMRKYMKKKRAEDPEWARDIQRRYWAKRYDKAKS